MPRVQNSSCSPCTARELHPLVPILVVNIFKHPITQIINLKVSVAFSMTLSCNSNHYPFSPYLLNAFLILYTASNS